MKKFLFAFASTLLIQSVSAQDLSNHIPANSMYVITIAPAKHVANGDMTTVNKLEMFTRTNEYGTGYNYLYGDQHLSDSAQVAFSQMFTDAFSATNPTGISVRGKMFIFSNASDSVEYWSYIFPLQDSKAFESYITAHLFPQNTKTDRSSGFNFASGNRISIGWTGDYAVVVLADYSNNYDDLSYWQMDRDAKLRDSIRMADAAIAEYQEEQVLSQQPTDSLIQARQKALVQEMATMQDSLRKDTMAEEEVQVYYGYDGDYEYYGANSKIDSTQIRYELSVARHAREATMHLLNMNEGQSMQNNKNFRDVQSEDFDAAYWYNYGATIQQNYRKYRRYSAYNYGSDVVDTSSIETLWQDAYTAGLFRFEGQTARMEQRSYFSPQLREMTQGMYHGKINRRMLKYVKGENLMGFYAMSADMERLMKFGGAIYRENAVQMIGGGSRRRSEEATIFLMFWDMAHIFLDEKTLYNLLDGDLMFAVTDLRPFTSSYVTYDYDENFNRVEVRKERMEVRPEFVMTLGVGEVKKAQELLAILERGGAIKKQNQYYYSINMPGSYDMKIYMALRKDILVVSNNEDLMQNHIKKGYSRKQRMPRAQRRIARKSPIVAWWNGTKTFELIKKNQSQDITETEKQSLDVMQKSIKSGVMLGVRPRNGVQIIQTTIELNPDATADETSMLRFFRLLNSLYLINSSYTTGY